MNYARKRVYLAGPITGLMYNDARYGWRSEFSRALEDYPHIELFSPMREKEFIDATKPISGIADYSSLRGFGTPNGILTRDHNDVKECDLMVACFLGAEKVSIGTCVEFGWASAYRKPIVMIMEPEHEETVSWKTRTEEVQDAYLNAWTAQNKANIVEELGYSHVRGRYVFTIREPAVTKKVNNPHEHLFLTHLAGYVVPTLHAAADITRSILTPGI